MATPTPARADSGGVGGAAGGQKAGEMEDTDEAKRRKIQVSMDIES
jgi:hypothetical protein